MYCTYKVYCICVYHNEVIIISSEGSFFVGLIACAPLAFVVVTTDVSWFWLIALDDCELKQDGN